MKLGKKQKKHVSDVQQRLVAEMERAISDIQDADIPRIFAASIVAEIAAEASWRHLSRAAISEGRQPILSRFIDMNKRVVARCEVSRLLQWRIVLDQAAPKESE